MSKLFTASVLLPFLLASPMILLGPYGLSLAEILIFLGGILLLLTQYQLSVPIPRFLIAYACLFAIGWLTAIYNASSWGIAVGAERLGFLYFLGISILAYLVGRSSQRDIEHIATGRVATVLVVALGIAAAAYPVMSTEARQLMLRVFWVDVDVPRFGSPRFPGMGINANLYAYTVLVLLIFSLSQYFKGRASLVVPLFAFIVIFATASKLVLGLALACCAALWLVRYRRERSERKATPTLQLWTLRVKTLYLGALACLVIALAIQYGEELSALKDAYVFVTRLEEVLDSQPGVETPLGVRLHHWGLGMERVRLAPALGIAMPPPAETDDPDALYVTAPHNEFIFLWSGYGLSGLTAYVFLLGYLLLLNIRRKSGLAWILFYVSLMVQMFFDGAFQAVRFQAMFFLIAGLNIRYMPEPERRVPLAAVNRSAHL